ncbi:MAG: FtsW/RodA/SpoVE family cell cycle protein [Bellilinea sp.]
MSFLFPPSISAQDSIERRLMFLAGIFLFLYSVALTLSPAVRVHSWAADFRWQHWMGYFSWLAGFSLLYRQLIRLSPDHDPYLLPIASLLNGWGLLTIWRLDNFLGMRQTLWLILGLTVIYLLLKSPHWIDSLRRYKYIWLSAGLGLTALTFFFGTYPGGDGPRLWLGCCGLYFQPSEPLKLLLIIYLAAYLAGQVYITLSLPQLLAPTLILAGAAIALLVAQEDLGTATLIIAIYTIVIYLASARRRVLGISLGLLLAAAIAGYTTFPVIRVRVDTWLNPWLDPGGKSYQLIQSFLAIATGRVFGTGPGLGSPSLIPVAQSDFIAASISEEMGLIGLVGILLLVGLFIFRAFSIAMRAANNFHRFLAAGLGCYFGIQSILIIGGNIRILPLTGVALPFVSYGGSSLLTTFTALGLLLVVSSNEGTASPELPRLRPYLVTGAALAGALMVLALAAGWWAVVRSDDLQFRTDNLRWTVHERYVPRGSLLDRSNEAISITTGRPGSYTRSLLYPALGTSIGYSDPIFGKGGLEAGLDGYLSGLQGNAASTIWLAEWIYGQPPSGLDVRLSIDLDLQSRVDATLAGKIGAAVILHAKTGEVLAIASQPSFDPNRMDEKWEEWRNDPDAPLLNRVTQGAYPPGSILGPFLYARVKPTLDRDPEQVSYSLDGKTLTCARAVAVPLTWETVVAAGCPGALVELGARLSDSQMHDLFLDFGFFSSPEFELPTLAPSLDQPVTDIVLASLGQSGLKVTPLQMALATAQLSNSGARPTPHLASAVRTPHQGWVVLPTGTATTVDGTYAQPEGLKTVPTSGLPVWDVIGQAQTDDGHPITWYISATIHSWPGSPLALALVLEEDNPNLAGQIGRELMFAALNP